MSLQLLPKHTGCGLEHEARSFVNRPTVSVPRNRGRLQPLASYRRYDGYYGRPDRGFWSRAASGFMNATIAEILEQVDKDFGVAAAEAKASAEASSTPKPAPEGYPVPMDSMETDDDIVYYVDVPGLEKKDLKIQINQQDRTLTVTGERFQPVTVEAPLPTSKHVNRFERRFGKFARKVTLPDAADTQLVSAKVDKGVLRIKVLKQIKQDPEIQEVEID